jgi:CDP-glycerol glycerophosphotransferase (TagB/SpsB family)
VFCLQHGLTIQRIAQYQNRLFDNTKLYFCVSPNEIENLSHPVYGYDPEMLLMTGAPRYDGLVNDDQKQILIAPTWRRNVTAGTNRKGHQHEYSINFKETEYYRIYNGLINNRKLIDCARETGYRIIYLVHPILSPQVGDFKGPEQVTILGGAGGNVSYEKMMCQSSLMLTDHSGIQFDFASMRKPLVYYHPDTLPPQYDAGGMNYETQAFGPVCRNEEEVVEALCRAMRSNCVMEEKYRARADAFFTFDDHDNCKRVFEAAVKHQGLEGKGK